MGQAHDFTFRLAAAGQSTRIRGGNTVSPNGIVNDLQMLAGIWSNLEHVKSDLFTLRWAADWAVGPYNVGAACSWDSGFLNLETTKQRWSVVEDYNWTREELMDWINTTQHEMTIIEDGVSSLWQVPNNIAAADSGIGQYIAYFRNYRDDLEAGRSSVAQVQSNIDWVIPHLRNILTGLKADMVQRTGDVAGYLDLLSNRNRQIGDLATSAQATAFADLKDDQAASKTHRCQGGVTERYTEIRNDLTIQGQGLTRYYPRLDTSMRATQKQFSTLSVSAAGAQAELDALLALIADFADDEPGSFTQLLHLNGIESLWAEIHNGLNGVWN